MKSDWVKLGLPKRGRSVNIMIGLKIYYGFTFNHDTYYYESIDVESLYFHLNEVDEWMYTKKQKK